MATRFKTLKEYLYPDEGHKTFVIPNYQRGYKWSVRLADEQTSVEYLMESLTRAFHGNSQQQFFLQGVTVVEDGDNIILIDGQQRTTTLYLLLFCLGTENITGARDIRLDYSIRKQSKDFLDHLKDKGFDYAAADPEDKLQDIYYFKQAISQIKEGLPAEAERKDFVEYLLNKISLLYIVIDPDKAVRTFTMMNGHKARMHDEELVKAEMLHLVSLPDEVADVPRIKTLDDTYAVFQEVIAVEWDTNALRSKYAREWDKWLYWWNQRKVKACFNTNKPMGLLLEYYYRQSGQQGPFSFKGFKQLLPDHQKKPTKDVFKGLRDLQKDFEDIFNDPIAHNYLRLALIGAGGDAEDKYNLISFFIAHKRDHQRLCEYAKWRLLGSTHIEVTEEYTNDPTAEEGRVPNAKKRSDRARRMLAQLSESHVYNVYDDILYKQLLRLNVEEYNKLNGGKGVAFDFSIWEAKSLEHIYPKSKFFHTEEGDGTTEPRLVRGDGCEITAQEAAKLLDSDKVFSDPKKYSEHCIGNLVLLYGKNNSEFGNLSHEEKKARFFNNERVFESRNLLHTIASFASSHWEPIDIEKAKDRMMAALETDYGVHISHE